MKTCVILNPSAGSAGDTESLREKLARLSPNEIKITAEPGEAQRFARDAASLGCDLIISAGGDGTLNEVVNGVAEKNSSARLAILPLGTGNDFARSIGLPANIDECIELIAHGTNETDRSRARDQ